MTRRARWPLVGFLLLLCCGLGRAQLVLGQYEDEAPLGTWNAFGPSGAASEAMGGVRFTLAEDATAVFSNPALLRGLPAFSLSVTASYASAEFYRYAVVNTGLVDTDGNVTLGLFGVDSAAVSFRFGSWALGLGFGLLETCDRPEVSVGPYFNILYFQQKGQAKVLNVSLARSLGGRLSVGVGFNLVTGDFEKLTEEADHYYGVTVVSLVSQDYSGWFLNAGLTFDITPGLRLAAAVRTPYVRKTKSRSSFGYDSTGGPYILIEGASDEDEYRLPLVAGLGLSYAFSEDLRLAGEVAYVDWSSYKVTYFGEPRRRDFRDIFRVGVGVEYSLDARFLGADLRMPLRAGLALDPQPMTDVSSTYLGFSVGSGLRHKKGFLDIAVTAGRESGSGRSLTVKRMAATLGFTI